MVQFEKWLLEFSEQRRLREGKLLQTPAGDLWGESTDTELVIFIRSHLVFCTQTLQTFPKILLLSF